MLLTADSSYPVYGWFDDGIIYYYTEADTIYLNPDSSYMFYRLTSLSNIDMDSWNTINVESMYYMFSSSLWFTWLNLSSWNTSNLKNMSNIF